MKKKRYRLRKKYRILLKKWTRNILVILLCCVTVQAFLYIYQTFFHKEDEQQQQVKQSNDQEKNQTNEPYDIIIDAGHGGRDPGCEWDDILEKHITLDISRQVYKRLEAQGYHVYMTRNDDSDFAEIEDYDLIKRVEIGEQIQPKLFVSIHVNFSEYEEATGCEVYYDGEKPFATYSANMIADEIATNTVLPSRGASETLVYSPIYIVDYNPCETVLVETAFLSNENDREVLSNSFQRVKIADAIAKGIDASFQNYNELE